MSTIRHASLSIRAASYDASARSCEAVLATERPVRMGREDEILVASGASFPAQIPLLDAHARGSVRSQLGSIRDIRSEGDALVGRLYLAETEEARAAAALIEGGHLTDVSVGYAVEEAAVVKPGAAATVAGRSYTAGDVPLRVATRWRLMEGSLTPIGADTAAKLRSEEMTMSEQAAAPAAPATPNEVEAERKRAAAIYSLARGGHADLVSRAVTEGWDEGRAAREILAAERAAVTPPVGQSAPAAVAFGSRAAGTQDDALQALSFGIRHQVGEIHIPKGLGQEAASRMERAIERGERYRDCTLLDIMRESLRAVGTQVPEGRTAVIREWCRQAASTGARDYLRGRAFSTMDLEQVFTSAVQASLVRAFDETMDPYALVARDMDVPDFRANQRPRGLQLQGLDQLPSGHEAAHFSISDDNATYTAKRFARQFVIDEQDIINDRLDMFGDLPRRMGAAARRLRPDLIARKLLNGLTDGLLNGTSASAIFSSGNANVTTGALASGTLQTAISIMRKQTELNDDGVAVSINTMPKFIIVPPILEWTAKNLMQSSLVVGSTVQGDKNVLANLLEVIVDPRLENGLTLTEDGVQTTYSGSATVYFLAADPAVSPTIEVGYVRGTGRAPVLRSQALTLGRYGIGYDIHLDIGVGVLAPKGLVRSTGA